MRLAVILPLLFVHLTTFSQTRVSPPPAKINLAELGQMDKAKVKKIKSIDRFKEKRAKAIGKQLKKHTGFSKEEIEAYSSMVKGLDSLEMVEFEENLEKVISKQDAKYKETYGRYKAEKRRGKKWKGQVQKYKADSIPHLKDQLKLDKSTFIYLRDSVQSLGQEHLDYGVSLDSLNNISVDTTRISEEINHQIDNRIDSSYLQFKPAFDTLNNDSLLYSTLENSVESFMKSFVQERVASHDLGLPNPDENQIPSVQQFVPELEKFNYTKPKIPDEKLTKALIAQEKEKKKERLKEAVLPKLQRGETEREVKWTDRWQIGGFVEYKPESNLIELTPTLAYGIVKKVTLGVGYSTVIRLDRSSEIDRQVAYRAYLNYLLINAFYIHLESEWKEQKLPEQAAIKERSTLLGLGRNFRYKSISTSILGLFNLSAPNEIDTKRFSVRFAVNFNP